MATVIPMRERDKPAAMNDSSGISDETAWTAVLARDRSMDGRFFPPQFPI